jgi:oxygen-independent coproporphyrinogen-3 oxidase
MSSAVVLEPSAASAAAFSPVESLYVHVPFCARKCEYCAFYSEASDARLIERYTEALVRELELVAETVPSEAVRLRPGSFGATRRFGRAEAGPNRVRTVFFGGGTPSLLTLAQWRKVFGAFERLGMLGAEEWSIECNPATVSLDKAKLWREFGVNRVSMGVQSLDEALLERLGRVHSRAMVFKSFDILRQGGFDNLNVDLMFAIPGQTLETWRATLDEALALGSEHLSSYEVIYEEDTPLFHQLQAGEFAVDEELACAMYDTLLQRTAEAGLLQYEVANFARDASGPPARGRADSWPKIPSRACRHNVNYWLGGAYHGVGPSACGYVDGVRTKNWSNTTLYCEQLEQGRRALEWQEKLPPLRRAGELAAFGLRMNAGWSFQNFFERTGFELPREWATEMTELVSQGWGELNAQQFRLTRQGLRFADAAGEMFLR